MSGVLHPMGPEPAQTYWVRRGVLLAVVLLLAVIVVFGVANLTKAAVATSPPPVIPPAAGSPEPSTSASQRVAPSSSASAPAPSGSAPAPSGSVPTASSQPPASAPTQPSTQPTTSTAAKPTAPAAPSAKATVIGTPDCTPAGLRVGVKGDRSLSPGQNNTFTVTLVNAAAQTCLASVTDKNFELKVFSGQDRIWSSRDCAKALVAFDKKLAGQAGVSWKMTWNGERSVKGKNCKRGADTPQAGTYWATAQLAGAKPVQLRMIIS